MRKIACFFLLLAIAGPALALDITVVDDHALFPEGPIMVDGNLYFVEYGAGKVTEFDGNSLSEFWMQEGSGPSAIAKFGDGFLVTGYDNNSMILVDKNGQTVKNVTADSSGTPMMGPNDIALDGKGGAYFSLSGGWESAPIVGKIGHMSPDGSVTIVADDLHYPNGLVLSADASTLFVNETYANRIIRFAVNPDGTLGQRSLFVRMGDIGQAYDGEPDGIKLGPDGNLYVGLYSIGRIVVLDPETGALIKEIDVPSAAAPNLTFSADGKTMYVTAVDQKDAAPWKGTVYAVSGY